MKINDIKHNHSLTDLLKVILFALIMLAPIGSIAARCLYVICNKNAYQSYYGETINESERVNITSIDKMIANEIYYFNNTSFILNENNIDVRLNVNNVVNLTNNSIYDANQLRFNLNNAGKTALFLYNNGTYVNNFSLDTTYINISFTYLGFTNNINEQILDDYITYNVYNKYSYLDNVFDYSVANIENNQLFNWTKNTALYSGINAMCTNLQISGSAIPIILTYWTLITIIYVIIDIVLKMFTTLTHLLSKKT